MSLLITTVGTTQYQETTYSFSEELRYTTCYVAEAVARLKPVDQVVFLLTPKARAAHWEKLQSCFSAIEKPVEIAACDIPEGQTEAEIWQIFDVLVDAVPAHAQVIFDITHAFRSIPILVLLGAAFLRIAKNVQIQGLYYGLYVSGQTETPIIDLTPALSLLDWLTATDQFIATGSAVQLGALLQTVHQDFYRLRKPGKDEPKPVLLQKFGSAIQDVSRSIELIRPISLIERDLSKLIRQSTTALAQEVGIFAKPFGLLLEQVQQSYISLALATEKATVKEKIAKQFLLLEWYVERRFTVHALLLAREWVVSAFCVLTGRDDYCKRDHRVEMEKQLNAIAHRYDGHDGEPPQPIEAYVADVQALATFWSRLGTYRNDLAHVQMNEAPLRSQALEHFALTELLPTLRCLFPELVHPANPLAEKVAW